MAMYYVDNSPLRPESTNASYQIFRGNANTIQMQPPKSPLSGGQKCYVFSSPDKGRPGGVELHLIFHKIPAPALLAGFIKDTISDHRN